MTGGRRLLVPEVVQTSATDCGPSALKSLLEGHGRSVSYGRLREACQTDVDGTSIDTIEEIANQLGLEAEQILLPADHLLLAEANALPAMVVVRLPNGIAHFVVAWRRHGRRVQVMDPASGRRWPTCEAFLAEVYRHRMLVAGPDWRAWAGSEDSLRPLGLRLARLGMARDLADRLIGQGTADPGWHTIASLDAAARITESIVSSGGLRRGGQASAAVRSLFDRAREETRETGAIPEQYWSVQPGSPGDDGEERLLLRGVVAVRVRGIRARQEALPPGGKTEPAPLSPELAAALEEPPARPGRKLLELLRADGPLVPMSLILGVMLAAAGVVFEALLFRGLIDLGLELRLADQRLVGMAALVLFAAALLLLDLPLGAGALRIGRHLESRLRIAFLEKIPRLRDEYLRSRLSSDMAQRSQSTHNLRRLPQLCHLLLLSAFELVLTTAGIIWIDPSSAPLAIAAGTVAMALPVLMLFPLAERDLRVRTHEGALGRFYLDTLLGLIPVRAHGAEGPVRREHEGLLAEWAHAGLGREKVVVLLEGMQWLAGFGLAALLLHGHLRRGGESGGALLLVYWALNLPVLGIEVALMLRQYPEQRNQTLRLLEPLGAPEDEAPPVPVERAGTGGTSESPQGTAIHMKGLQVKAAGHTILEEIDLVVGKGEHLAILGPSGAGKSTLVGTLLGWHRPSRGGITVDDAALRGDRLEALRHETAWVDPAVRLWNRPLLDNLLYGTDGKAPGHLASLIEASELKKVLEALPDGLQTPLGEGGALVSGGEGQRVRLGRAMMRRRARLVILDEPFRGLDRTTRSVLLARARAWWRHATLLCVTHDVAETRQFDRVVIVEAGRIVETGPPALLADRDGSRYGAMLRAEAAILETWSGEGWRHLRLEAGRLVEES